MKEIWKDIKGYEGLYQISNLGNVKKIKNKKYNINKKEVEEKEINKYISIRTHKLGYKYVKLTDKNGIRKNLFLHRLIAQAFIPNPNNYSCINHINGIKNDNRIENLEWCSQKQNVRYAWDNGLCENVRKVCAINGKRKSKKIIQKNKNGEVIKVWNSTMDIERELGILHNNITFCCKHYNRTAGGFIWEYYKELGGK